MTKSLTAESLMKEHKMNCAQTVLSVFCEDMKLDRNTALKIASGFGGGMGRMGRTCGAVSGAYMVLGLSQELSKENPRNSIDKVYALVKEFNRRFEAENGSFLCRELLGCDLGTPEGLTYAREKNLFTTVCPSFVKTSVAIVESLIK